MTKKNINKELKSAGSSGRADACPRMTGESGRSMVEMLGVLAVMGVLSVAGIAGYTTAMNNHRANEAINSAMRAAVMLSAQRLANPNATLNTSDFGDGITVGSDTDKLVLTLSNVDEKVRSRIKAMGVKNADIDVANDGSVTFTFSNDLSERGSGSSGGNTSGGSGQQEPVVDLCAGVDCNTGTCSNGKCDCTGTGYTGDHCETPACTTWLDGDGNCCISTNTPACCNAIGRKWNSKFGECLTFGEINCSVFLGEETCSEYSGANVCKWENGACISGISDR